MSQKLPQSLSMKVKLDCLGADKHSLCFSLKKKNHNILSYQTNLGNYSCTGKLKAQVKLFGTLLVSLSKGDEPRIFFANKSIKNLLFRDQRRGSRSCSDNQNKFSAF